MVKADLTSGTLSSLTNSESVSTSIVVFVFLSLNLIAEVAETSVVKKSKSSLSTARD